MIASTSFMVTIGMRVGRVTIFSKEIQGIVKLALRSHDYCNITDQPKFEIWISDILSTI